MDSTMLLYNIKKSANHRIEHTTLGIQAKLSNMNALPIEPRDLYFIYVFNVIHTNPLNAFLERTSANPNTRFGMTNNP
jgi:hypothetical protein